MDTTDTSSTDGIDLPLDLGFTLGLEMPFREAVEWAATAGFEFVEILLDGPYTREQIEGRATDMRATLDDNGVGVVVHLPFAIDPGTPFGPVRKGIIEEFKQGMDLATDLGAERVVFHPSSDTWDLGWSEAESREFVHDALDELVPAARERGLVPCLENIVSTYYDVTAFPELLARYPEASMTFDTSHALLAGFSEAEMAAFCSDHADRIEHLHLVDTREGDEHLPVGMGNIEFAPVLQALAAASWRGTATLEIGTEDYDTIALGKRHVEGLLASGDAGSATSG